MDSMLGGIDYLSSGSTSVDNSPRSIVKPNFSRKAKPIDDGLEWDKAPGVVESGAMTQKAFDIEKGNKNALKAAGDKTEYGRTMIGLAGAEFTLNVVNAQSAYSNVKAQAQLNIVQARNQAQDALYRGHQAQLDAQSEGYNAGQESEIAMAAQGQDVHGAGAEKIRHSYEAMGIYNGMKEEINGMKEALGYKMEEVGYDYQEKSAKINRDMTMIGSALNYGASAAYYGSL